MAWVQVVVAIVLFVVSELIRPKPKFEDARPLGLGDFNFPTATEGRPIPLIWGTVRQRSPNVTWYGNLQREPIIETVMTGLFSSETFVAGFKYRVGMQMSLCRGQIDGIEKLWVSDQLAYDGALVAGSGTIVVDDPLYFGGDEDGNGGIDIDVTVFDGSQSQGVSGYLSRRSVVSATVDSGGTGYAVGNLLNIVGGTSTTTAQVRVLTITGSAVDTVEVVTEGFYSAIPTNPVATAGAGTGCTLDLTYSSSFQSQNGQTPAYVGTAYVIPTDQPFYVGNSTRIEPWSFQVRRIPNDLGLLVGTATINGKDANPMSVLYEVLTNKEWGLGRSAAEIDTTNFTDNATTLATEGNGFSMLLDREIQIADFINEIERQIDGVLYVDQLTGLWKVNLARGGYDIDTVPQITDSNCISVSTFNRGSWEDTTNIVQVEFFDESEEFKQTFAVAQDMANQRIQNGVNIVGAPKYPGVKNRTLANQLAWRDLRALSFPRARAKLVVDRTFFALNPGEVIAFSNTQLGLDKLPMRVNKLDLGDLIDGRITLELTEDNFVFRAGSFADPPASDWTPPAEDLRPFLTTQQLAIEAPRAFTVRDPLGNGEATSKVWCGARRRGVEHFYTIRERHDPSTDPTGSFADAGNVYSFMFIGTLKNAITGAAENPTTSLLLESGPDSQAAIEAAFTDYDDPNAAGTSLNNLILIDESPTEAQEFMLVTSAQTSGSDIQLNSVYRGALDTVQSAHAAGCPVYLVSVGGGLTDVTFGVSDRVDIRLLPKSVNAALTETEVTEDYQIDLIFNRRCQRPYPVGEFSLNNTVFDATSVSWEFVGSGPEDYGIDIDFLRRDFRTMNEVEALLNDAATLDTSFPSNNTTTVEVEVRLQDNTLLFSETGLTGTQVDLDRIKILEQLTTTGTFADPGLRLLFRTRHTFNGTSLTTRQSFTHDFTSTSELIGKFYFGPRAIGVSSATFTATVTGTYTFTLSSTINGDVEIDVNSGGFVQLIASASTSNTIAITSGDTIVLRHQGSDGKLVQLDMDDGGGGAIEGFMICVT